MRPAGASAARHRRSLGLLTAVLAGCTQAESYVVVTVEDPHELAGAALALRLVVDGEEARSTPLEGKSFPLTIGFESPRSGERQLELEAWANDTLFGRAKTTLSFVEGRTTTSLAVLRRPCAVDADCGDEIYCDATTTCVDAMCEPGPAPCPPTFDCVVATCVEGARTCSVTVDHAVCAQSGSESPSYCNPNAGCVQGAPCLPENNDEDCQDDSVCNGRERCSNFLCVSSPSPDVSDRDRCTLDGCDDDRAALGLDPIFHVPFDGDDGISCTLDDEADGVCVAALGGCVPSTCGDGVIFGGELCDDGADNAASWAIEEHCNADCTGPAPFCGDGLIEPGQEACDDGSRADSQNGCSDTCQRNDACGDRVIQGLYEYETCDDGNADPCDGCKTNCQSGCICNTPLLCVGGTWCGASAACEPCDTKEHCGTTCVACGPGEHCALGTCTPCNTVERCGPTCAPCDVGGTTPICGGSEVGCVTGSCTGQPDFTRCRVAAPTRSYNICVGGTCVEPGCGDSSCNAPGPSFPLPDSGQRACYDDSLAQPCSLVPCNADGTPSLCGQDAQYGWDVTHAASERFIRSTALSNEPLVTDSVTGLMWQGCVEGRRGDQCEVVVGALFSAWSSAVGYCDNLSWGGFVDWRLPDRFELSTLVDSGRSAPPYIDGAAFPQTPFDLQFWTASTSYSGNLEAWLVTFQSGLTQTGVAKAQGRRVRCVRGGSNPGATLSRFTRSLGAPDEPVVSDSRTALVWQGCPAGRGTDMCTGTAASYVWTQALAYCEALSWGGQTDWRLPQVLELASLVDDQRALPAIDPAAFPQTAPTWFLTASSWSDDPSYALSVMFDHGSTWPQHKTIEHAVRCVRGAP